MPGNIQWLYKKNTTADFVLGLDFDKKNFPRESCGTCGFLSSLSKEKQVYNKQSYSRISDPDFDCGR